MAGLKRSEQHANQSTVSMVVWNTFQHDARVRKEALTLSDAGYEVCICALHAPGFTTKDEDIAPGVRVRRFGRIPGARQLGGGVSGMARLLVPFSVAIVQFKMLVVLILGHRDVIHAHDVNVLPLGWLAARLSRAKLIYDAHEISTSREGYRRVRRVVTCLESKLAPRADAMLTTNKMRARYFARAYRMPRPAALYNWPPCASVPKSNRLREELGLDDGRPLVLYQGGLQGGRGLELLIEAAAAIDGAWFVFIGAGPVLSTLRARTEQLNIVDRVRFVPTVPVSDLPSYTASADIGVQALENTCFNHFTADSNKLFEYLAAGLPVVTSNLPIMANVVRRYDVGKVFTPGDGNDLTRTIRSLVDNQAERARLSKNARVAAKELCWETQADKLVDVYERIDAK